MAHQLDLTIRAKIKPGQMGQLRSELDIVNRDIENNALVPFARLGVVHFARFVILEEARDLRGNLIAPTLVFASNVDAPLKGYLDALMEVAAEGLDKIFSNCEGYPAPDARTRESRLDYLSARRIKTQAFYINTIGRTAEQVRQEAQLRESIEAFLDGQDASALAALPAGRVGSIIQDYVRGEPSLKWALTRARGLSLWWRAKETLRFVFTVVVLLFLTPLFLLLLPLLLVLLRYHEKRDARTGKFRLSLRQRGQLEGFEDHVVQNQISAVGHIKPGWFRYLIVRVLLRALSFAARHVYNKGDLGTFKPLGLVGVNTIHFAQWVMIDEGRRMLFMSNYDGSLVSYMDDFVNKVAWGLNAVFSNGYSYPKTDWLFLNGAHDEQAFKAFLQEHQIPTQAWYTAYKQYTALNLTNNAELRAGLFADLSERERAAWLQRL
ncbi:MAG TPA: hypothetical protein VK363_05655 [Pyrinomonadaceae bacterium]|nr:hypothetical protein [Pyrinomonadaceae bacterium]